jgi:hypothetical protein
VSIAYESLELFNRYSPSLPTGLDAVRFRDRENLPLVRIRIHNQLVTIAQGRRFILFFESLDGRASATLSTPVGRTIQPVRRQSSMKNARLLESG